LDVVNSDGDISIYENIILDLTINVRVVVVESSGRLGLYLGGMGYGRAGQSSSLLLRFLEFESHLRPGHPGGISLCGIKPRTKN
jgi:hypothetical protein